MSARVIVEIRTGLDVLRFERSDEPDHRISPSERDQAGWEIRRAAKILDDILREVRQIGRMTEPAQQIGLPNTLTVPATKGTLINSHDNDCHTCPGGC